MKTGHAVEINMEMCFTNLYSDNKLYSTGLFSSFTVQAERLHCISAKADHVTSDSLLHLTTHIFALYFKSCIRVRLCADLASLVLYCMYLPQ